MLVERIHTEYGSHIEPPLNQAWDELTQLRWKAAVVACDSGVALNVHPAKAWTVVAGIRWPIRRLYSFSSSSWSTSGMSFEHAWTYLNGVGTGADQCRRTHGKAVA